MLIYRLSIWSNRGRIERDIERDRHDALECIHAAGLLAAGLQDGGHPVGSPRRAVAMGLSARSQPSGEPTATLVREAQRHLKEAWLLLSHAGAQEAVAHVRNGLRLSRAAHRREA